MSFAAIEWRSLRAQLGGLTAERNRLKERIASAEIMGDTVSADRLRYEVYDLDSRIGRIQDRMGIARPPWFEPPKPPKERKFKVTLSARSVKTRNLGSVEIDGNVYKLPKTVRLKANHYIIRYIPQKGYEWVTPEWETSGDVYVQYGMLVVEGEGTLTGTYEELPATMKVRKWEFTRYYRYLEAKRSWDNRHLELRLVLVFPADWTAADIEALEDEIAEKMDGLMKRAVWAKTKYPTDTMWVDLEEDLGDDLDVDWVLENDWARGVEPSKPIEIDAPPKIQNVTWTLIDYQGHYLGKRGSVSDTTTWKIPEEEEE